ncbi:hypothetical protein DH2020_013601 [Rehmannia glutinosa]|uniref:Amidase domain-containing protein n=1 Tax=Rehmannia glutinosa TaxID=99300 RepID=A0ABR0X2Q2_REHGL
MASSSANLWVLLGLGIAGILIMTKKLKRVVKADFGAFIERLQLLPPPQPAPPKAPHPLTGLSFAVSDVFNIEGFVTGFGNPDWSRTHEAATRTCPVVAALVDGGATCVGKTVVDDMALSVSGESKHYDTPTNPASPARIPGGASSGAAVAVAAKLVDFSLGELLLISVEKPLRACSEKLVQEKCLVNIQMIILRRLLQFLLLWHRYRRWCTSARWILWYTWISAFSWDSLLSGVTPVSGSLDTVGWFAKDPSVLRRVGHVLLQVPYAAQRNPRNIVIADDCFQSSKFPADRITQVVIKSIEKLYGRQVLRHENLSDYIKLTVPSLSAINIKQLNGEEKYSPVRLLTNVMQLLKRFVEICYLICSRNLISQVKIGQKTKLHVLRQSRLQCKWWDSHALVLLPKGWSYYVSLGYYYVSNILVSRHSEVNDARHEFRQTHNEWINSVKPTLDPAISAQISEELDLTDADIEKYHTIRSELRSAINALLKDDGILVIPTSSDPPAKLGAKEIFSEEYLIRTSSLSSLASMSGCCQVALPVGVHEKCPVSLSLLARHGGDRFLLDTLQTVYASFQEQADTAAKPKSSSKAVTQETSAEMAKEKGNQAFKDKQWQRAIGFYTEAIKLNSSNATYYSNRAAAYLEMGRLCMSSDIIVKLANVKAYLRRGTAREMLGYYKEAMEDFRYALVLEPNNKRAAQSLDRLKKLFA